MKRIAVIGGGAIGSVVAGSLMRAGQTCTLIGRTDHVAAIQRDGLCMRSAQEQMRVRVPADVVLRHDVDLAILAVKTQDITAAWEENQKHLQHAVMLTTQNGVQADNLLKDCVVPERHVSSIVMFGATFTQPGEVTLNFPGDWIIGRPDGRLDRYLDDLAAVLRTGFDVRVTDRMVGMKWLKLFVNFNNCLPALVGQSMQETFADMDVCRLSIRLLKEGWGIVQSAGIKVESMPGFPVERIAGLVSLPEDEGAAILQRSLTGLSAEPVYGSILQSIMRKKPSEIDYINGEVVRLAAQYRLACPLNAEIVRMVHKVEEHQEFWPVDAVKRAFSREEQNSLTKG